MTHFVPREKMGKKARKALDAARRRTWPVPPVMKTVESGKRYNRHKDKHDLQMTVSCFLFVNRSGRTPETRNHPLPRTVSSGCPHP